MIKRVIYILCIILTFISCVNAFAEERKMVYRVGMEAVTDSEYNNIIGRKNYSLTLNGEANGKSITVLEYASKVGDFISLREFVEAIGGKIEWNPNKDTDELGYFELFGRRFKYTAVHWEDFKNSENSFRIYLSMFEDNEEVMLSMNPWSEELFTKVENNKIYIGVNSLNYILPRIGYIFNINKNAQTFNIKSYDFEKEKKYMLEMFPIEKVHRNDYAAEYNDYIGPSKNSDAMRYCFDIFHEQIGVNVNIKKYYRLFIDDDYKDGYFTDDENFYKGMLQASYGEYIDEEIYIDYDEELESYIVYNEAFKIDSGNFKNTAEYKIIVIRKFDSMILFRLL